jgi:hypothetical protein
MLLGAGSGVASTSQVVVAAAMNGLIDVVNSTAGGDSGGAQIGLRSQGTNGSGVTKSGDWLGVVGFSGYYTGTWEGTFTTTVKAIARENHTNIAQGTGLVLESTPIGSTGASKVSVLEIWPGGGLRIFAPGGAITPPTVAANEIGLGTAVKTTIGANGAATALTANPVGYWRINVGGTAYQVPYYNV